MAELDPNLLKLLSHAYAQGRRDFVKVASEALTQPGLKDVPMTSAQVAETLRQASQKCDEMAAELSPKALTNRGRL